MASVPPPNPFAMPGTPPPGKFVVPNAQTPKLMGILCVVFGALLMLCDIVSGAMAALAPTMTKSMQAMADSQKDQQEAVRKQALDEYDRRIGEAKTEEEKSAVRAEKSGYESRPRPMIAINTSAFDQLQNKTVLRFSYAQVATGFLINAAMLVGGIGLMNLRGWARTATLWIAGLKIVRLVLLAIVSFTVLLPIQIDMQKKQFALMEQQMKANNAAAPPGPSMANMAKVTEGAMFAFYAAYYLTAPIFPIVLLASLTRPRVRAAFPGAVPEVGPASMGSLS